MPKPKSSTQVSSTLADIMEEMEDKTKGHKEQLAKMGVRSLSLESLPREMGEAASICLERKDYDAAADACAITRLGFSLYFNAFASPGACPAPVDLRNGIYSGLQSTLRAVGAAERAMSRNGSKRSHLQDVRDFRDNVRFRVRCWRLLHSKNGRDRVLQAVAKRSDIPLVFDRAA